MFRAWVPVSASQESDFSGSRSKTIARLRGLTRSGGLILMGLGLVSEAVYLAVTLRLPWWRYGDRVFHTTVAFGDHPAEATQAFERVVELNPRMVSAWDHLLVCYYREGDLEGLRRALAALEDVDGREAICRP